MVAAEIDFVKLKTSVNGILDVLIERSRRAPYIIDERKNNYWEILGDDLFDISNKPSQLGMGSLSDDLELLENYIRQLNEGNSPVIYNLIHIVPILRYIAEQHSQSDNP